MKPSSKESTIVIKRRFSFSKVKLSAAKLVRGVNRIIPENVSPDLIVS